MRGAVPVRAASPPWPLWLLRTPLYRNVHDARQVGETVAVFHATSCVLGPILCFLIQSILESFLSKGTGSLPQAGPSVCEGPGPPLSLWGSPQDGHCALGMFCCCFRDTRDKFSRLEECTSTKSPFSKV